MKGVLEGRWDVVITFSLYIRRRPVPSVALANARDRCLPHWRHGSQQRAQTTENEARHRTPCNRWWTRPGRTPRLSPLSSTSFLLMGNEGSVQPRRPLREAGRPRKSSCNLGALSEKRGDADMAYGKRRRPRIVPHLPPINSGGGRSGWERGRGA